MSVRKRSCGVQATVTVESVGTETESEEFGTPTKQASPNITTEEPSVTTQQLVKQPTESAVEKHRKLFEKYSMHTPSKYLRRDSTLLSKHPEPTRTVFRYTDRTITLTKTGSRKEKFTDGFMVIVFENKDVRQ